VVVATGRSTDRAANLKALLEARQHYTNLLKAVPSWNVSQYDDGMTERP